jgi:hypothetical protein
MRRLPTFLLALIAFLAIGAGPASAAGDNTLASSSPAAGEVIDLACVEHAEHGEGAPFSVLSCPLRDVSAFLPAALASWGDANREGVPRRIRPGDG